MEGSRSKNRTLSQKLASFLALSFLILGLTLHQNRQQMIRVNDHNVISFWTLHSVPEVSPHDNNRTVEVINTNKLRSHSNISTITTTISRPPAVPRNVSHKGEIPSRRNQTSAPHREKKSPCTSEGAKTFSYFFSHIPKSGTSYSYMKLRQWLIHESPEWQALSREERFLPCDMGLTHPSLFESRYNAVCRAGKCNMWMAEYPATLQARVNYAVIRDPFAHTVSNYFHCTESRDHQRRAHLMPGSIDDWLSAWVQAMNNETKAKENKAFKCYDPRNFLSRYMHFNGSETKEVNKERLKERFRIIGDQARLLKSTCMVYIDYTDGWIPDECNCSHNRISTTNRTSTFRLDHGVSHHGDTFNLTENQRNMIESLRADDMQLYKLLVDEIFEEQVLEIENKYNVTICDR